MGDYLLQLWNMSYQAGLVIIMILAARLVFSLMKVPKKFSYVLWAIPFFRMICPWTLESPFSLLPAQTGSINDMFLQKMISFFQNSTESGNLNPTGHTASTLPSVNSGIPSIVSAANPAASGNPRLSSASFFSSFSGSIAPEMIIGAIWLGGILLLCLYSIVSCWRLKKKLVCSIHIQENIYLADHIDTPFTMGILKPHIYLPSHIQNHQMNYVVAHEQVHIHRKDHLFKSLAFVITCLHWFNPLAWIAFIYMNKDMEMSCDEAVLQQFSDDRRKEYASALLELTAGTKKLSGIWLAFGKGNTKERIVNIMKHKKPMTFLVVLAGLAVIVLAAVLLTNPRESYATGESGETGTTSETIASTEPSNTSKSNQTSKPETEPPAEPGRPSETDDELLNSSLYGLEIQEDTLTETGATFLIHNRSQKEIEYGDSYHLSQLKDDNWADVSYVIENWGFHDIAYNIPSGQTATVTIDWEWLYGSLPAGTYLLTKTINVPKSDGTYAFIELGVHFELK